MAFVKKNYEGVSIKEFNKHLEYCKKYRIIVQHEKPLKEKVSLRAYLVVREVEIELTYKFGYKVTTFITRLDGEDVRVPSGMAAWTELNKFYKVPRSKFPGTEQHSSSGILWKNEDYENTRLNNCIGYDINSAYTWAMCQDMPDTSVEPKIGAIVKPNEIGFDCNKNLVFAGKYANIIYPKISSPFKRFAETWYNRKKNATNKADKQQAKDILNASIGYLQRTNPVLRTAILWYANNRMFNLIKKYENDILYCNTDSIISKRHIDEIEKNIGDGLGEWKIEHIGDFAFKGYSYQWNKDIPSYRGISKSWFPENWDILIDEIPKNGNKYYLNMDKLRIMLRE